MDSLIDRITPYLEPLSQSELTALQYDWPFWARDKQLPPGSTDTEPHKTDWRIWLILAGRGWGKTRTGAEFIRQQVSCGNAERIALVGETWADVRDVMIEGESGLLSIHPFEDRPNYEPSKRRLTWPNGAQAFAYSASEPDQLRGPQFDLAWADELAKWDNPGTSVSQPPAAWNNLLLTLRLGSNPRVVATTTPRPLKWMQSLAMDSHTTLTSGTTYENAANLAPAFLEQIIRQYEGTNIGRQELDAQFLLEAPGALWNRQQLAEITVDRIPEDFSRIVVAVDPAVSATKTSDETGIVVVGLTESITEAEATHSQLNSTPPFKASKAYVLADWSLKASPDQWARAVVQAAEVFAADRIVAEANQGGEMVETLIRMVDPNAPITRVHATRGKLTRAEPVAALYEQKRVYHTRGLNELEEQMCHYTGSGASPDRLDALVWGIHHLMLSDSSRRFGMARTTGW